MSLETAPSRGEPWKDEASCGDARKDSMHKETAQASRLGLKTSRKIRASHFKDWFVVILVSNGEAPILWGSPCAGSNRLCTEN